MGKLKMFTLRIIKKFSWTIGNAILLIVFWYSFWPIEPTVTADFKLDTVVGMPEYRRTDTAQMSGISFMVNAIHLNCDLGMLSGHGGCEFFRSMVNLNRPVRATYFWMPTQLGYHFKVLYSLEQDGILIVPAEQLHAWHMRCYRINWDFYHMVIWLFLVFEGIFFSWEALISEKIENYLKKLHNSKEK
jgi:hypothetical protein